MYNGTTVIMTIRHGETDFNRERRYAGLLDITLNDKGIHDCRKASARLAEPYDVVVTSALQRSIETAHLLTGGQKPILECALCNERNYGHMQGRTAQEVETIRPEIKYIKIADDFHSLNPPQGESFPALHRRAREFLRYLLSRHRGARILVVSHGVFLQQFHGVLRGESWRTALRHDVFNLTLSTFVLRGTRLLQEECRNLNSDNRDRW
jgi:broad specificity phosphatase PhoE